MRRALRRIGAERGAQRVGRRDEAASRPPCLRDAFFRAESMTPAGVAPPPASSELQQAVELALGADGALASIDANHAERAVQLDMALAVAAAIEERGALVVEAGTGVGKTFAYLVPALLSGARTLAQHRDQDAPGPALHARPAAPSHRAQPAGDGGASEGSLELSLPASARPRPPRRPPSRPLRGARARQDRGVGAGDGERRPRRARGPRRAQQHRPARHVVARELPRQRLPRVPPVPRDEGAPRGDARRRRRRQPSSLLRRHGVARQRRRRAAAKRRGRDLRRGAPARRGRRPVPRHHAWLGAADRLRPRHARRRACSRRAASRRGRSSPPRAITRRASCASPRRARSARSAAASSCAGPSAAARPRSPPR